MDRRTFVRASVGAAGAVAVGAGAAALGGGTLAVRPLHPEKLVYVGAHCVGGPAPRGTPYVPIRQEDGRFVINAGARASPRLGLTQDPIAWHVGCVREDSPGLQPDYKGDDALRYHGSEDTTGRLRPWYADRIGEVIRPEDFPAPGFGANFTWRSKGTTEWTTLHGVIVWAEREPQTPEEPTRGGQSLTKPQMAFMREQVFAGDFIASSAHCTHFCCIAGWRLSEPLARQRDAWDKLFCACHSAVFDVHAPTLYKLPRGPVASRA